MIRRILIVAFILSIISGCGFKDLDKRFFVVAIGIDLNDDESKPYKVTLKLAIPSAKIEPGKTNRDVLMTENAATISEAIQLIETKLDKDLDFGHAKMIVFGKPLLEKSIKRPLDWLLRRRDIQLQAFLAAGDPTAIEVMKVVSKSERLPGNALVLSFDKEAVISAYISTETLMDFSRRISERGKDPYLPVVIPKKGVYEINQIALLKRYKLITILTPEKTRDLNMFLLDYNQFEIHAKDTAGADFVVSVSQFSDKYALKDLHTNEPTAVINVNITASLEEADGPAYNKDWNKIGEVAGNAYCKQLTTVLKKLQKKGVDPVGFGLRYRAMGYLSDEDWERWEDIYPRMRFDVRVKVKIIGTGVIK